MNEPETAHRLYGDLAWLWPVLSPPGAYEDEARGVHGMIGRRFKKQSRVAQRLLELGSGGGHMLFHLQKWYDVTGSDLSEAMIQQSMKLNPLVTHYQADMRTLRLGEVFDVVLIHDALGYMKTASDVAQVLTTAAAHLAPGGLLVLMPDEILETFEDDQQAEDAFDGPGGEEVGLVSHVRMREGQPRDGGVYELTMSFTIKRGKKKEAVVDRHHCGLFASATWERLLKEAGFKDVTVKESTSWRGAPVLTAVRG